MWSLLPGSSRTDSIGTTLDGARNTRVARAVMVMPPELGTDEADAACRVTTGGKSGSRNSMGASLRATFNTSGNVIGTVIARPAATTCPVMAKSVHGFDVPRVSTTDCSNMPVTSVHIGPAVLRCAGGFHKSRHRMFGSCSNIPHRFGQPIAILQKG